MAITIRLASINDAQAMQNINLHNLPENYTMKMYLYHLLSWPQASFVATTSDGDNEKIVGYVLGKMDDDPDSLEPPNGQITSLSVMRTYRKMGIAEKLMRQCLFSLCENFKAEFVMLHVRESNRAALHLYQNSLKFELLSIEKNYYLDDEDAYHMKKFLKLQELLHGNDDLSIDLI